MFLLASARHICAPQRDTVENLEIGNSPKRFPSVEVLNVITVLNVIKS